MNRALCASDSQKTLRIQNVILLYFVIFSAGLCKLCWVFSRYLYQHIDVHSVVNQMCDWIAVFPHEKLPQLLFFGLSLIAMFGLWGLYFALTLVNTGRLSLNRTKQYWLMGYLIVSLLINMRLVTAADYFHLDAVVWALGFLALVIAFCNKKIGLPAELGRNGGRSQKIATAIAHFESKLGLSPKIVWVLTAFITLGFICIFYPLIFKPIQIANEFMDIPEQTLLRNGQNVDNSQYINQHHIGGLHLYDPRHDQGVLSVSGEYAQVVLRPVPGLIQFLNSRHPTQFVYDAASQTLSLKGKMTHRDYAELLEVYSTDPDSQQLIKGLVAQTNQIEKLYRYRIYSPEEQAFIAKNSSEIERKVKAGWVFFHHSWVLNPILALSQGADAAKQVFLYGYGSAAFLKHVLQQMGAVSFQNYFKATFIFYPIYFFIFLAGIYALFQRADLVCIGAVLLSASFLILGYQMILLAPGYNPMRHLFDMLMLVLFFQYVKKNSLSYLLLLLLTGFATIVWSKDFGLLLTFACLGTTIIKNSVMSRGFTHVIAACLGLVGAVLLYGCSFHGINYNFWYMLLGYTQPMASTLRVIIILAAISLGYLFYIQYRKMDSVYFWLALCVFFYLQFQAIYYIWHPSLQHLLVLSPMLIVCGMASLYLLGNKKKPNLVGTKTLLIASILFLYLPNMTLFYKEKMQYDAIFATHVVHDWKFQSASFQTTMEPRLFSETLDLIDRYAPNASIYLISKYDDILPVLAQRSNALPVVNLVLDLMSKRDMERCKQAISNNKPRFLFVDSDIHRDLRGDVMLFYDPACLNNNYQESYGRFTAIKNMRTLYDEIQDDYTLIEKGSLLSVYQRKQGV